MNEQFRKLKNEYCASSTSAKRKIEIDAELDRMANENPAAFAEAYELALQDTAKRVELYSLREQIKPIAEQISLAYIAKKYFGRSKEWLYQRINGYNIHGKAAKFTDDELSTLNSAIHEIGQDLTNTEVSY